MLCRFVEQAPGQSVPTRYAMISAGREVIDLVPIRRPGGGMVLRTHLPAGVLFDRELVEGDTGSEAENFTITMRDHDLDGAPDDSKIEPFSVARRAGAWTDEGFIRYKRGREHEALLIQWTMGIGYAVNRLLHGIDSPSPR